MERLQHVDRASEERRRARIHAGRHTDSQSIPIRGLTMKLMPDVGRQAVRPEVEADIVGSRGHVMEPSRR